MRTLVETVLLYGSKTWSFSTRLEKRVDRCYKNPLRRAQNFSQKDHAMLERVYGGLATLSLRLKQKHLQFTGHCYREIISSLILGAQWAKCLHIS